ncbi:MAG: glycosyltransferase [Actinobacteria bacterium]|nr:glycosyltransferase [Actinomycetota bacterium]
MLAAARALRALGDVVVVTHGRADRREAEERFGWDLEDIGFVQRPERAADGASLLVAGTELFVNATHYSHLAAPCTASIKFEYFPVSKPEAADRLLWTLGTMIAARIAGVADGAGWYGPERIGRGWFRQSDGNGALVVHTARPIRIWLSDMRPSAGAEGSVYRVVDERSNVLAGGVCGVRGQFTPTAWFRAPRRGAHVYVQSVAQAGSAGPESRLLGLSLGGIEVAGLTAHRMWEAISRRLLPAVGSALARRQVADYARVYRSYAAVSPNSAYTAYWLKRWWGIDGHVIEPPVVAPQGGGEPRGPTILTIGRFFRGGHSKKHDVMVGAFRRMCDAGLRGWRFVLAGGVGERAEDRAYLAAIQRLAQGYPIDVHPDADDTVVQRLRGQSSVYWHAAGFAEDAGRHPERFEHFGMAVAEAMAGGVPPVVYDGGGPRAYVRHRENGLRWRTADQLVELTLQLVRDAELRRRLGTRAADDVRSWSLERYEARVLALAKHVLSETRARPTPATPA